MTGLVIGLYYNSYIIGSSNVVFALPPNTCPPS
jgi:hypothetical protein